jgi:hypothetical protein
MRVDRWKRPSSAEAELPLPHNEMVKRPVHRVPVVPVPLQDWRTSPRVLGGRNDPVTPSNRCST